MNTEPRQALKMFDRTSHLKPPKNWGFRVTISLVVKAGSKGKEPFRRPLRKRLKLSRLRRISSEHRSLHFYHTCVVSLLGAGVPAEAESEMVSA